MSSQILQYNEYVTLIGGGNVSQTDFDWSISRAPGLLAADGGADRAISLGRVPDAAIGDFDSISPQARAALPADAQYHIAEQDSTDFDKCLRVAQAPLFVGLGFLGPRSDHQLAALTTLARNPDKRIILVNETDVVFLCPPVLRITLPVGCRFSLFPFSAAQGESQGLQWPIGGIRFSPDTRVGTSNRTDAPNVMLRISSGRMLVILPRSAADDVITALAGDARAQ